MMLAFMGAEVIKIESMKRSDLARRSAFTTGQRFTGLDQSSVFNDLNLNKLSVTLNLSQPEAVELAKKIVSISDVVAQNMRPGVMDRLGLGYEELKKIRPDIIMLSSSASGATGPQRNYIGYAPTFAGMGGVTEITGYPDGPPIPLTGAIDIRSATTSAFAILAALNYRQRTGQGQHIDMSSTESICVLVGDALMEYTVNHRNPSRNGNRDSIMAPHNCYRCQGEDMWVTIAVASDAEWEALCQAMGSPAWTQDERFTNAYQRWQNQNELDLLIEKWTMNYTTYEIMEMLQKAGVAAVPAFNGEQLFNDPHSKEREWYTEIEHPVIGKRVIINPPWKLSGTPARIEKAGPLLGQHNDYVFGELLGIPKQDITRLIAENVIY